MKPLVFPFLGVWAFCVSAFAGGMVNNLTQAELEAALAGGGTVLFGTNGTLTLTNTITIALDSSLDANGNTVTISGASAVRLFQVNSNVAFLVKNLVLADGQVVGTNGANIDPAPPGQSVFGAGILNKGGNLTLIGCTLSNHQALGGNAGHGITTATGNIGGDATGAAICSFGGTVNLTNCLLTGNAVAAGQGTIFPSLGPNMPGWDGGRAFGGAIYSAGTKVSLEAVRLTKNSATGGAPGYELAFGGMVLGAGDAGAACGGGFYAGNSTIFISGAAFESNMAKGGSPSTLIVNGGGASGAGVGGALFISQYSSGSVALSSFTSNSATGGGGLKIYSGGSSQGGSIYNSGDLQVSSCTFAGGSSTGGDGSPGGPGGVGVGGAIVSTSRLGIDGCLFVSNRANGGNTRGSTDIGPGEGGALWCASLVTVTNSTFTANRTICGIRFLFTPAPSGFSSGGGLYFRAGTASLLNVTIAGNSADTTNNYDIFGPAVSAGGGLVSSNCSVTVHGSIIANNLTGGDVWGTVTDAGYNICSDGTANFSATGSLNRADPLLSALSNNGGPTATMSPLAGSPARDAISSGFPPTDQRGVSRPQGSAADIGAVEADFIPAAPAIVSQPVGQTVRAGTNVTFITRASGTAPLSYQWSKDGHPVNGATSSALSLLNVQATQAGAYSVVVTNAFGSAVSQGAILVVDSTPLILMQPTSMIVSPGAATNFVVAADGPSLSYQWWHDGSIVTGGTASTLNISSALAGAQGDYYAVVSNFAGMATSAVATLTFDATALSILVPPRNTTVETGYPATFSVTIFGFPPFSYQWEFNGKPISGATGSAYAIGAVTTNDAGNYDVVVTNEYKTVLSPAALLTVTPGAGPPFLVPGRFGQSLTITFAADAGRSYRLLSSTNLAAWLPVATNAAIGAGPLQFVQPIIAGPPVFYRVVTP